MIKPVSYKTADDAVSVVRSGDRVFVHGSAATPGVLLQSLLDRHRTLRNVELVCISTFGEYDLAACQRGSFFVNSLFVSKNIREAVNGENGDYVPVFLSEIHLLFDRGILAIDVALIHVSPPDAHGYCSLGTSVDVVRAAVRSAKRVIAQVNPQVPRTHGDGMIHVSRIHDFVAADVPLPEVSYAACLDNTAMQIGRNCAALIEDGSTLQMGIGAVPDAVLYSLKGHRDLGVHTEMFSDGLVPLIESGAVTNGRKKKHAGKTVTSFVAGTRRLYDFVNDNPSVAFLDASYVNDTKVIRTNPKVVAVNSALEIDLTGQVSADSLGTFQYSGVGGQMDFIRGAALSEGGKPIIAMRSTAGNGQSRIVPFLKKGGGVVTTRAHVHYVVTEHGVADLFGKNLRQRAQALLRLAAPEHRESLDRAIFERFGGSMSLRPSNLIRN